MLTVEVLTGHTPLPILHLKTCVPNVNPVTALVANDGVTIVAVPDKTDQVPVPTAGPLPFRSVVGELIHSV